MNADLERSIEGWLERHNVPRETIEKFLPFLADKIRLERYGAMKDILATQRALPEA